MAVKASQRSSSGAGGGAGKIAVLVVIVVVVAGAAAWWFLLRATPEKALAKYVAAAKAGNEQAAKACLTTETVKGVEDMQQSMSALGPMAGNIKLATSLIVQPMFDMDVKIGKAEVKGDSATVPVTLVPKQDAKSGASGPKGGAPGGKGGGGMMGGQARPIKMKLEGGQWKIDMAQEMAIAKQMMAYFAGGAGGGGFQQMAQQMGQQMAEKMGAPPGAGPAPAMGATPPGGAPAKAGGGAADLIAGGMADKKANNLEAAAAKFQQALQIDANNSDAHWGMAWVLAAQGKKPEARAEFEKVTKLSTDPKRTKDAQDALARLK